MSPVQFSGLIIHRFFNQTTGQCSGYQVQITGPADPVAGEDEFVLTNQQPEGDFKKAASYRLDAIRDLTRLVDGLPRTDKEALPAEANALYGRIVDQLTGKRSKLRGRKLRPEDAQRLKNVDLRYLRDFTKKPDEKPEQWRWLVANFGTEHESASCPVPQGRQ